MCGILLVCQPHHVHHRHQEGLEGSADGEPQLQQLSRSHWAAVGSGGEGDGPAVDAPASSITAAASAARVLGSSEQRSAAEVVSGAAAVIEALSPFCHSLERRGPDSLGACHVVLRTAEEHQGQCGDRDGGDDGSAFPAAAAELLLCASLLQLRGGHPVRPPLISKAPSTGSSVLCFNGEVLGGRSVPVAAGENDGEALLRALELAPGAGVVLVCLV